MAYDLRLTNAVAQLEVAAIESQWNTGYLRIYSGVRPVNADTAISGQVLLAELRYAADAVASSANGVATFGTITGANAVATGTASFYRDFASNGTTVICDGEIGTTGSDLNLSSTSITSGAAVSVTSKTHTVTRQ